MLNHFEYPIIKVSCASNILVWHLFFYETFGDYKSTIIVYRPYHTIKVLVQGNIQNKEGNELLPPKSSSSIQFFCERIEIKLARFNLKRKNQAYIGIQARERTERHEEKID